MSWPFSSFCDGGLLRCHVYSIRAAVAAGVVCLIFGGGAATASASAGPGSLHGPPVEVAGATGTQVVLKWQAKSPSAEGQWRVYRSADGRKFTLAQTIEVVRGIQNYRYNDLRLRTQLPSQAYQLRYLGPNGEETVVAIATCTGSGIEDTPVAPSTHFSQTADLVYETLMRPMTDEEFRHEHDGENRSWHPEPEFPPPRAA